MSDDKITSTTFRNQLFKRTINIKYGFRNGYLLKLYIQQTCGESFRDCKLNARIFQNKVIQSGAGSCEGNKHRNTDKTSERAGHTS